MSDYGVAGSARRYALMVALLVGLASIPTLVAIGLGSISVKRAEVRPGLAAPLIDGYGGPVVIAPAPGPRPPRASSVFPRTSRRPDVSIAHSDITGRNSGAIGDGDEAGRAESARVPGGIGTGRHHTPNNGGTGTGGSGTGGTPSAGNPSGGRPGGALDGDGDNDHGTRGSGTGGPYLGGGHSDPGGHGVGGPGTGDHPRGPARWPAPESAPVPRPARGSSGPSAGWGCRGGHGDAGSHGDGGGHGHGYGDREGHGRRGHPAGH